jgi:hypothetical protein
MPDKGVARLLRDDERGKSAAPPFRLGNPIALSGPCPDEGYAISAERRRCDKGGDDQRTGQCFHPEASKLPIRSTKG